MHRVGELRCVRVVGRKFVVGRRFAVSAPHAFDGAGVAIEHGHAMVAVTIGGINFVGSLVVFERGNLAELAQIRTRGQRAALADFGDELAVGGELQHHHVGLAVAGQPNEALVVDEDAVFVGRPVIAEIIARAAPRLHHLAGLIEHQHRRRRHTAFRARRIKRRAFLVVGQRARPLEYPDIVRGVDGNAADLAENPIVRQRFRPVGIDAECRALGMGGQGGQNKRRETRKQRADYTTDGHVVFPHVSFGSH